MGSTPLPVPFMRLLSCCLTLFVCAAPCAAAGDAPSNRVPVDHLASQIEAMRAGMQIPAVGLAIVSADAVLLARGFGVRDLESREPVNADTLFRIGSITKAFTGVALLMAQEDGVLALDDPVRRHLAPPPYLNPWEDAHPVRIAHLLELTAGLQDMSKAEFDFNTPLSLVEAFALEPASRTVRWQPGRHAVYTNNGAGIAAAVLEQATERTYEDFVGERIFAPLAMNTASLTDDPATRTRLATGYAEDGHTLIPYWHILYRPASAINASPREMAGFVRLLLNRGRAGEQQLLNEASIARLETPATSLAAKSGLTFGYGLGVYAHFRRRLLFYGHGGDGDGYHSYFGYNRDAGLGYFVVINVDRRGALRRMAALIENWIATGMPRPNGPTAEIAEDTLRHYTGRYELAVWRYPWQTRKEMASDALTVELREGRLFTITASGRRSVLIPVNARHFRREHEPAATSAFVEDDDGRLYFQEDENWIRVP